MYNELVPVGTMAIADFDVDKISSGRDAFLDDNLPITPAKDDSAGADGCRVIDRAWD
jgi:hypothetical protein